MDYLDRRTTIPVLEQSNEALATVVASCGRRDEPAELEQTFRLHRDDDVPELWIVRKTRIPGKPRRR